MERRKSSKSKSFKRLSIKSKGKTAAMGAATLPTPNFPFEDVLVSQLQVADVIHNSVLGDTGTTLRMENNYHTSPLIRGRTSSLFHRCYHETKLTPLWQTFASLDNRCTGNVLLGRLMNLSSNLSHVLGEEHHKDTVVQKNFIEISHVSFTAYKQYVMDTVDVKTIEADRLCAACWLFCKHHYLNNPLVDSLDSVVPTKLADSIFRLFCIFIRLTEPHTYPPSMDYEEAELLLRKLVACLGMSWLSSYDESLSSNDENERNDDYEPNAPLQVTFKQLLSVIADMIGVDTARSNDFHRAVERLCLIEYQEIIKTGWLMVRKAGTDIWKKRWTVLQGTKLTFYVTVLCQYVKKEINLSSNMHIEALPSSSSNRHRFRIVEKEGFNIKCEHEFLTAESQSSQSWITLVNLTLRINDTGMSAKTSEICERRLERLKRRESEKEVYRKKQDVLQTYKKLENARKMRSLMEERLGQRAQLRAAQAASLDRMDRIYDKLEALQHQRRLHNQEEREKKLSKIINHYEKGAMMNGDIHEEMKLHSVDGSDELQRFSMEQSRLEFELENLKLPSSSASSTSGNPAITVNSPRKSSVDHAYEFSCSSSENMSTASTHELSLLTLPDVTSYWNQK
ncbi:unnamed protein product [Clavelina lepadiformis]|uniref:PH domain-containing protein n=1 Tax=Clavelina lepadiformis TaxID=159417 RepID=A0ABP0GUU2_CLALP